MENYSSSKDHPSKTGLLELHRELAQTWGIDFQRVHALMCQLASDSWCLVSDLIARSMLSHWNVSHLLRQLHPWLEHEGDQVRIRTAFQELFTSFFDCSSLSNESLLTPYEVAAKVA